MNRSVICSVLFVCALLAALAASAPAACAAGMPVTGTITPSSGSLFTDVKQSFVATFSDPDGHADIADCRVLLNTALEGAHGIFLRLDRTNNRLWLRSDNNAAWLGGHAPGSGNVIENDLCTIHCDRTTFSGNGNTLTLNISLTLKWRAARRTLTEWLYAGDAAGNGDGWNEAGAIAVVLPAPTNTSVSPSSGLVPTGQQTTFTTVQSDPNGYADVRYSYLFINEALSMNGAVYAWYDATTNKLWLRNDDNKVWLGGKAPGSANTIENSRAKLICSGTTVVGSGEKLTITWRLEAKSTMQARTCGIWLYAVDKGSLNTGFEKMGEVTFAYSSPRNISVSPSSGLVPAGQQTFTTVQSDPNGYADLKCSYLLINNAVSGIGAVYAWYDRTAKKLYLRDDANATWLGGYAPGSGNTIENSRAKLLCSGTTVTGSGQDLTINWALETKPTMQARKCGIWLYALDMGGANTGFDKMGEVTFVQPPANASLAPSASSSLAAGSARTLTATYTDSDGHADIRNTYLVLNTALSSFRGISLWYDATANKLYLRNDLNTVWTGGHTPGAAGVVLENSYCRVHCAATTVERDGNNLRVNWSIEPKSPMVGKTLKAWMYVIDTAGATDGWDEMASYIIGADLNVSVSPINTSLSREITTTLTTRCLAPNGQSATSTYLLLNSSLSAGGAVYLYYDGPGNKLWLRNDAGSAWLGGYAPGSANTIRNNLVTVNCAASTAAMVAHQLEVRWSVQFSQTAGGRSFNVWMYTLDTTGLKDGWDALGTLNVVLPVDTEMIYISPGSFLMGNNGSEPYSEDDELPQHEVFLPGYWLGKYEVTRGEYRQFMEAGGYSTPAYWSSDGWSWKVAEGRTEPRWWAADQDWGSGTFTQTESHPVVGVTYYEAEAYCAWADGHLPTEAQWEKAARWAGSYPNVYPWGNVWDAEKCNNWDDHNSAGGGYLRWQTAPAGSYPSGASPYGLQDMAGNVWEWCRDWYQGDYYSVSPSTDPQGPSSGSYRVLRGGGWDNSDNDTRCASRSFYNPSSNWNSGGFRLARGGAAVATPTFDPDGGRSANPVAVTVSCATIGATIHYTTNGIDPTESDPVVASGGQVMVSESATLKARAWKAGWYPSTVKTSSYTIDSVRDMIYIPAGSFLMGNNGNEGYSYDSEFPQHSVYLSGYWIGKYEVTRGEYRRFMEAGGYSNPAYWSSAGWSWKVAEGRTEPDYWAPEQDWEYPSNDGVGGFTQTDYHPVVGVVYYEAEAYCAWAGGHLPTEAQWEKAARWTGSYPNMYPWGNTWDAEKCNSWDDHNSAGGGYQRYQTAPVGSYPSGASPYGLQDMAGNVFEWCRDWYSSSYYSVSPSTDPQGPTSGSYRIMRGSCWFGTGNGTRCACRSYLVPYYSNDSWYYYLGFRVAR